MSKFSSLNQPENRGRPKGARNKLTMLLEDEAEEVIKVAIKKAKEGDSQAIQAILRYVLPTKKAITEPLYINIDERMTLKQKVNCVLDAVCNGQVDPTVATGLVNSMANAMRLAELEEIDNRISKLEAIANG
ncbi:hypothetical protein [Psychrosphaera algicola]|uniref:DUF5681 domain-containing protein n=1 Tax=Psychrosphaera algicola TaxID=3023714 RepID=A0ABT5FD41_9GAMM|nr:hypothetical protein [Psychrosphaera sp. G1-22]MDC2888517.1 hypothetical protein [Psychrosphaera sp. G1-22]